MKLTLLIIEMIFEHHLVTTFISVSPTAIET